MFNGQAVEDLLDQETAHWTQNLEQAREDAAQIEQEINAVIERS